MVVGEGIEKKVIDILVLTFTTVEQNEVDEKSLLE